MSVSDDGLSARFNNVPVNWHYKQGTIYLNIGNSSFTDEIGSVTVDGVTPGNKDDLEDALGAFFPNPAGSGSTTLTYQYKVGRGELHDPVADSTTLTDSRLNGVPKSDMIVHEAGYGNKLDADYDLVGGGGIELLNGKKFDVNVAWFITVFNT